MRRDRNALVLYPDVTLDKAMLDKTMDDLEKATTAATQPPVTVTLPDGSDGQLLTASGGSYGWADGPGLVFMGGSSAAYVSTVNGVDVLLAATDASWYVQGGVLRRDNGILYRSGNLAVGM